MKNDKTSCTTEALAQAAENAAIRGDSRNLYKITKELTGEALVKDANCKLPNNKAARVNGLTAEFFKAQSAVAADMLNLLINATEI